MYSVGGGESLNPVVTDYKKQSSSSEVQGLFGCSGLPDILRLERPLLLFWGIDIGSHQLNSKYKYVDIHK